MIPAELEALLSEPLRTGRIPGVAFGVIHRDGRAYTWVGGWARTVDRRIPLREDHVFDLASLTKVFFTTGWILRAVEEGRVDLDDRVGEVLGLSMRYTWQRCSLRQLLSHQAGMPAWAPVYEMGGTPEERKRKMLEHPWPLGKPVYSDLHFLLLGVVLERVYERPLHAFPLPEGFTFHPDPENSVATERCGLRGRILQGEVHDENAWSLGGVAGHAGLFGTLQGILNLSLNILRERWLSPASHALMRMPHSPTRTLGWVRAHPGWSGGSLVSPETLGHTGFTGTGVWLDFRRGYAWTLLTNRVHPSRTRETGIGALRRRVGNWLAAHLEQLF